MSTTQQHAKTSTFLLFPWSLTSIVLILILDITLSKWLGRNWSWIALLLIIPPAILENFKVGFSTMKVMFLKIFYSLISFLVVGLAFGIAGAGWYYERFENYAGIPRVSIPWYVLLALAIILLIEIAHIYSMLKAVRREFMQYDPGQ
jgi:hypothetical protein